LFGFQNVFVSVNKTLCSEKGWIPVVRSLKRDCVPCQSGFFCPLEYQYPKKCDVGMWSVKGSVQCCPRNMTCPVGFAVNANKNCSCTPIECPFSLTESEQNIQPKTLTFNPLETGDTLICKGIVGICTSQNMKCSDRAMVQYENNCLCVRRTKCMNAAGENMQYWYSNTDHSFECIGEKK
jgi:hypothetical protein